MYNARQPQAFMNFSEAGGSVPATVQGGDAVVHKYIEEIIDSSFMKQPAE